MANINSSVVMLFGANIVADPVADEPSAHKPDDDDHPKGTTEFDVNGDPNTAPSGTTVYNPVPLRVFMPQPNFQHRGNPVAPDHDNGVAKPLRRTPRKKTQDNRKPDDDGVENVNGGEKKKRSKKKAKDSTTPLVRLEEIPELLKQVEDRNGIEPTFLYGKELQESDVLKGQNRLLVNKGEKFAELFAGADLKEETVVEGVDGGGNTYRLGLKIWKSGRKPVVKKEWGKLVEKNGAEAEHWVQVWGFRVGEDPETRPCLAIHFVKPDKPSHPAAVDSNNGAN